MLFNMYKSNTDNFASITNNTISKNECTYSFIHGQNCQNLPLKCQRTTID